MIGLGIHEHATRNGGPRAFTQRCLRYARGRREIGGPGHGRIGHRPAPPFRESQEIVVGLSPQRQRRRDEHRVAGPSPRLTPEILRRKGTPESRVVGEKDAPRRGRQLREIDRRHLERLARRDTLRGNLGNRGHRDVVERHVARHPKAKFEGLEGPDAAGAFQVTLSPRP